MGEDSLANKFGGIYSFVFSSSFDVGVSNNDRTNHEARHDQGKPQEIHRQIGLKTPAEQVRPTCNRQGDKDRRKQKISEAKKKVACSHKKGDWLLSQRIVSFTQGNRSKTITRNNRFFVR